MSQRILNARHLTIAQILVKQSKGATPAPSEHPSRPSFEEEVYLFKCALDEAPINHRSAKKLVGPRAECSRRYIYHSLCRVSPGIVSTAWAVVKWNLHTTGL